MEIQVSRSPNIESAGNTANESSMYGSHIGRSGRQCDGDCVQDKRSIYWHENR